MMAPLLAKGFRPFFLLAAAFAAAVVPYWLLAFTGRAPVAGPLLGIVWHGHEMVYGFAVAVVAGFLLTAVTNWTQRETATGGLLLGLAALWLAGRVALLVVPGWVGSVVDLLFLPALAVVIARPIVAARSRRNYGFPALLLALAGANLAVHLDAHGVLPGTAIPADRVAVSLVVVIVLVVTGRIVPLFTRNTTGRAEIHNLRALDLTAIAAALVVAALQPFPAAAPVLPAAQGVAAVAVFGRMVPWGTRYVAREPLLWVLHVGHAFVGVGFALGALGAPLSVALHATTVGGFGVLILGMMARVALGHTGRPLRVAPAVTLAFVALVGAALVRVVGPLLAPALSVTWFWLAAGAWSLGFTIYAVVYLPILTRPRPDGKAG